MRHCQLSLQYTAIGGHRPCAMVNSTGTSNRRIPRLWREHRHWRLLPTPCTVFSIACAMRRRPRPGRDARRRLGPRPCAFPDERQLEPALKRDRGRDRSARSGHPRRRALQYSSAQWSRIAKANTALKDAELLLRGEPPMMTAQSPPQTTAAPATTDDAVAARPPRSWSKELPRSSPLTRTNFP